MTWEWVYKSEPSRLASYTLVCSIKCRNPRSFVRSLFLPLSSFSPRTTFVRTMELDIRKKEKEKAVEEEESLYVVYHQGEFFPLETVEEFSGD